MNPGNSATTKATSAFGISLAVASMVNALLVVAKEKSPAVMTAMQRMTGHHWITHVVVVLVIFFGVGGWLARRGGGVTVSLGLVVAGVVAAAVIIIGFYLTELL